MDKVLTWATERRKSGLKQNVWSQKGEHTSSYEPFLQLFQWVFDYSPEGKEIGERLLTLKQGNLSPAD